MEPLRVLVVDDHVAIRRGIRTLISGRSEWAICGEASDGLDAVEKARQLRPNLILMDVSMPRMDGLEATRHIRRDLPECEVLIISQNDPAIVREQAKQVGANGCVAKMDLARDLVGAVTRLTQQVNERARRPEPASSDQPQTWLFEGGILGRLIREYDWSKTPLGSIELWPQSLKTSVNLMLNSQHPMWIGCGPEMTFLYNDAYVSVLSLAKHPWALGRPASEVWREIWDICGPLASNVFSKGEPAFAEDVRLFMSRGDSLEETYYSFSYSPIYDESGRVGGLFCPSTETTAKVLNARRLKTLSKLSATALVEKTTEAACASSLATLAANPDDIPFSLLYLLDSHGKRARLEGVSQLVGRLDQLSPSEIDLSEDAVDGGLWPVRHVVLSSQARVVTLRNVDFLPPGPAEQEVHEAIVLPVTSLGQERAVGALIAGVNPTRKLDAEYRTFNSLVADQVATAIQNARVIEEEKKRSNALIELDRAKTVFFSNVSHEFRTPLTLMLGPIEDALAEPDGLSSAHRTQLEIAHRNSLRLLKLVNTLLDFSRMEAGRLQATYEPTDLAALTAELASVFRSGIERSGLQFHVNCPVVGEQVYVDREMWEKIVFNLLSNALKYTFTGEIEISLREDVGFAELSVRDTGTGISADELPHLFERFRRVQGARGRTFEGTGIGLALVQELTKLHCGEVKVESKIDSGSTFTVRVPLGTSHLPADRLRGSRDLVSTSVRGEVYVEEALRWLPEPKSTGDDIAQPAAARRPRILLADDNADMRDYVRRLLAADYEVQTVKDGEAALQCILQDPPDLVVSDVMMPRMDGFKLLEALRTNPRTAATPILLLSARAGESARVEGIAAGADDYLVKPFSARELTARIETQLRLARVRREVEARVSESEKRLQMALDASRTIAWTCDLSTGIVSHSGNAAKFLGLELEPSISENWTRVHPEDAAALKATVDQAIASHSEYESEFRALPPIDAPDVWLYMRGRVETNSRGEPVRIVGTLRDITEKKKLEAEIRENERRFREMIDALPAAVYTTDADGRLTHYNPAAVALSGRTPVLGTDQWCVTWKLFRPDGSYLPHDDCPMAWAIREGKIVDGLEVMAERPDGKRVWFTPYPRPMFDADGRIMGGINMLVDITERKRFENALAGGARRQRALFELADRLHRAASLEDVYSAALDALVGALQCDRASILLCDQASVMRFASWRGLSEAYRKAVEGHSPWAIDESDPQPVWISDIAHADLPQALKATVRTEGIAALAFIPLVSNGKLVGKFMTYFNSPHSFSDEELALSLTFARQLAFAIDRKRSEEALRQSEDRFRKLSETLDAEVRARTTELEARNVDVLRQAELLRDLSWRLLRTQDNERRHVARELHDSAGQTLTVLGMNIAGLVAEARQHSPELASQVEETQRLIQQLNQEIRTTSYLLHPPLLDEGGLSPALGWYVKGVADRSGLDIRLGIADELGRLPRDMELVVFRLVQECLPNIHRHSGSKSASIQLARRDETLFLEVQDEGKGITPERVAEIQSRGSGLGIRGMRERVRQYAGELNIDSGTAGTRILVTIPILSNVAPQHDPEAVLPTV